MLPRWYFRTCDRCGEVVRIASDDPSEYVCSECGSRAAWEYPLHSKALEMQAQIRDAQRIERGRRFAC